MRGRSLPAARVVAAEGDGSGAHHLLHRIERLGAAERRVGILSRGGLSDGEAVLVEPILRVARDGLVQQAEALDPLEPMMRTAAVAFGGNNPRRWERAAPRVEMLVTTSNY